MARVLAGALRPAADCSCRQRLGGYASIPWMSWRHPAVRQGQHRRGYSGRTSERSHHVVVGRDTFEVQGDEKLGLPRS